MVTSFVNNLCTAVAISKSSFFKKGKGNKSATQESSPYNTVIGKFLSRSLIRLIKGFLEYSRYCDTLENAVSPLKLKKSHRLKE